MGTARWQQQCTVVAWSPGTSPCLTSSTAEPLWTPSKASIRTPSCATAVSCLCFRAFVQYAIGHMLHKQEDWRRFIQCCRPADNEALVIDYRCLDV